MLKGLYAAHSGMVNEQNRMDVLTNNLANASTAGYKKEGSTSRAFKDVLAFKIKDRSEDPNVARRIGIMNMGVKIGENYTDYTQGSFRITDNACDMAISGDGFFAVRFTNKAGETSTKYTRDGGFTLNNEGYLVTKDGDYVLGTNGEPVRINPLLEFSVEQDGSIAQDGQRIARLQITDFEDYNYLEHYGENYYQPVEGAREQATNAKVYSGYLEASNVQVVSEMVQMIAVTRAYETNQKIIQTYDGSLEIAVNQIGKL